MHINYWLKIDRYTNVCVGQGKYTSGERLSITLKWQIVEIICSNWSGFEEHEYPLKSQHYHVHRNLHGQRIEELTDMGKHFHKERYLKQLGSQNKIYRIVEIKHIWKKPQNNPLLLMERISDRSDADFR